MYSLTINYHTLEELQTAVAALGKPLPKPVDRPQEDFVVAELQENGPTATADAETIGGEIKTLVLANPDTGGILKQHCNGDRLGDLIKRGDVDLLTTILTEIQKELS